MSSCSIGQPYTECPLGPMPDKVCPREAPMGGVCMMNFSAMTSPLPPRPQKPLAGE